MNDFVGSTPQLVSSSSSQIVAPTVIAVVLFVGLVMVITVATAIVIIMRRRHNAYRKSFDNMAYGYVKASNEEVSNPYELES